MTISDEEWATAEAKFAGRERREFELLDEDVTLLREACRPLPFILVTQWERENGRPRFTTQDYVNAAWKTIGERRGFDFMGGVEPVTPDFRRVRAVPQT